MKKIFKGLAVTGLLVASSLASAQGWNFGGGYSSYMEDDEGIDISLGALFGSVGYTYESGNLTFMPELRLGVGVGDDTVSIFGESVKVEIDTLVIASIRGQYNVAENFGIFLQPSYARLEATASTRGFSETADDWEFGFGGGATFKVSESASIEAMYEAFDESDVVSVGIRFTF